MKKRVTIITWLGNTTLNYGSALQATAMQELLRKENCNPTTIDFMYLGKTKKEIASALLENGIQYTKTYFKFQQWYKKYIYYCIQYDQTYKPYHQRAFYNCNSGHYDNTDYCKCSSCHCKKTFTGTEKFIIKEN